MKILKQYVVSVTILLLVTYISSNVVLAPAVSMNTRLAGATVNWISFQLVYTIAPYAVAMVEHTINRPIGYGDCRVKNLVPDGFLLTGRVRMPGTNKEEMHLRAVVDGKNYDITCPTCEFVYYDMVIRVKDYKVQEQKIQVVNAATVINYIYIRTALLVQRLKHI